MKRRRRILHLTTPLDNYYSTEFWRGASDRAKALGHNFVSLAGGMQVIWLDGIPPESAPNEIRSTLMYQLPDRDLFDGVIIWGAQLKHDADDSTILKMLDHYRPLPIVSVGWDGPGVHGLSVDNYQDMKGLVKHLITVHGHRKIACLKADVLFTNQETKERFQAVVDAVNEAGLELDPRMVVDGGAIEVHRAKRKVQYFDANWGLLGLIELIDARGLVPGRDFTALVAHDDPAALACMEELTRRGYRVPDDVAIIGFDNMIQGRCSQPPLSTVSQSFRDQGAGAVSHLDAIWQGRGDSTDGILKTTRMILRESCGCPNRFAHHSFESHAKNLNTAVSSKLWNKGKDQLSQLGLHGRRFNDLSRAMQVLATDFRQEGEDPLELVPLIEELAHEGKLDPQTRAAAGMIAGDLAQRFQLKDRIDGELHRVELDRIEQSIFGNYDLAVILPSIVSELPALGAKGCNLVIFDQAGHPDTTAKVFLSAMDGVKRAEFGPESPSFPVSDWLPAACWPDRPEPWSLYAQCMAFNRRRIGYMVLEDDNSDGRSLSSLTLRLSGALEGAFLLRDLNQKQHELEKAYGAIVELSNQDPLTGLKNRRAFELALQAEHRRLVRKGQGSTDCYSILFIDLDNFKFYNDNFGHEVGDSALLAFASFAGSCVRDTDTLARFGGDEFVCLLPDTPTAGAQIVAERIIKGLVAADHLGPQIERLAGFSLNIPADCRLNCSIGIGCYQPGMDREMVMRLADAGVYLAKKAGKGCWKIA